MKMAELDTPVIYGLGVAKNGMNYALIRCGPPLKADGRYETETAIRSTVLEGIGTIPCNTETKRCDVPLDKQGRQLSIAQIAAGLDTTLDANNSGLFYLELIAIQTDNHRAAENHRPHAESDAGTACTPGKRGPLRRPRSDRLCPRRQGVAHRCVLCRAQRRRR